MTSTNLTSLPNIGSVVAQKLVEVGITNADELRSVGSQMAWLRLKKMDSSVCLSMLCALEGAIQGIRWHGLDADKKQELREFYQQEQNK